MIIFPRCEDCRHLKYNEKISDIGKKYTCGAFPDGIPLDFLFGAKKNDRCSETVTYERDNE